MCNRDAGMELSSLLLVNSLEELELDDPSLPDEEDDELLPNPLSSLLVSLLLLLMLLASLAGVAGRRRPNPTSKPPLSSSLNSVEWNELLVSMLLLFCITNSSSWRGDFCDERAVDMGVDCF